MKPTIKSRIPYTIIGLLSLALAVGPGLAQGIPPAPPAPAQVPRPPHPPAELVANQEDPPDAPANPLAETSRELWAAQDSLAASQAALGEFALVNARPGRPGAPDRTLVIPKDPSDAKNLAETEEDLNVMARILEKAARTRDDRNKSAMGIFIHSPFSGPVLPQNLYIEGYGALFLLNVNYPLVPPPVAKKEEAEPKEDTSSEWEEARRELYRPPQSGFDYKFDYKAPGVSAQTGAPAEKYDPDKVEALKKDLTIALKNAAHIRRLKSDETVTLVVSGRAGAIEAKVAASPSSPPEPKAATRKPIPGRPAAGAWSTRARSEAQGAKLILRAKKSDIDAFQKDKFSLDDFRKKVNLMLLTAPNE